MRQLRSVKRSLSADAMRALVQAFVHCRLDYCNSLLTDAADVHFKRLQSVQNAPLDWFQGHVVTTTSPWILQNSTGFQCARELCSRLWCWCGSVLTALLPATSPNSAFLCPLLQIVSISGQPRRAYYKFPGSEPRSAGGASLSRDHLCGTVFLLLYGDQR